MLPPRETPRAGAIESEYSREIPRPETNCFRSFQMIGGITLNAGEFRQRLAVGLADIEDVGGFEADDRLLFVGLRSFRLGVLEDHRRENEDALLAFADEPAQLAPGVEPGDVRGVFTLRVDQHDVVEAVAVESRHRRRDSG